MAKKVTMDLNFKNQYWFNFLRINRSITKHQISPIITIILKKNSGIKKSDNQTKITGIIGKYNSFIFSALINFCQCIPDKNEIIKLPYIKLKFLNLVSYLN